MPGICPGKCLSVIWWLNGGSLRIKLLFWTDESNWCFILTSKQPISEAIYPSRLDQHICVCFPFCPPLKKKKLSDTCFICIENRVLKSCGIRGCKTTSISEMSDSHHHPSRMEFSRMLSEFNSLLLDSITGSEAQICKLFYSAGFQVHKGNHRIAE